MDSRAEGWGRSRFSSRRIFASWESAWPRKRGAVSGARRAKRRGMKAPLFLAVLSITSASIPVTLAATAPALTPEQRESLRFRLETLFNEADLLIRNQRVDRSDIERQGRDAEGL